MTKRSEASKARKMTKASATEVLKDLIHTHFPYALIHRCGQTAFYMKFKPAPGDTLNSEDCILPNGNKVDAPKCFFCEQMLEHADFDSDNIKNVRSIQ